MNGKDWKCTVSCKKIAQCNSAYSGHTVSSLTENDKLCTEWSVNKFESTLTWWIWECGNATTNISCSAQKISACWDGFVDLWEECDDGKDNGSYGKCTVDCKNPVCWEGQNHRRRHSWGVIKEEWKIRRNVECTGFQISKITQRLT